MARALTAFERILMSIDGPHDNVLVMKPPMCFSRPDAERFISALDSVLATVEAAMPCRPRGVARSGAVQRSCPRRPKKRHADVQSSARRRHVKGSKASPVKLPRALGLQRQRSRWFRRVAQVLGK